MSIFFFGGFEMSGRTSAKQEYDRLLHEWRGGHYSIRELDEKIQNINSKYGTNFELVITNHFK